MKHFRALRSLGIAVALVATMVIVPASPAAAASMLWSASALSDASSNPGNWDTSVRPGPSDDAIMTSGSVNKMVEVDTPWTLKSMTIAGGSYTLYGASAFTLTDSLTVDPGAQLHIVDDGPRSLPDDVVVGNTSALWMPINYDFAGQTIALTNNGVVTADVLQTTVPGGGLVQSGTGQLNIDGAVAGQANVEIAGGTLGTGALMTLDDGTVNVGPSGVLAGEGSIGTADVRGNLYPGTSGGVGRIEIKSLAMGANPSTPGTLHVDILGSTFGNYDVLDTDQANLTGATLSLHPTIDPQVGDVFEIIKNAGSNPIVGTFTGLPEGATFAAAGEYYKISYTAGASNNEVHLTVVPEPQTVQFSSATATVAESAGNVDLTVTRNATTGTETVGYATANGTATQPADYTSTSGTLTFLPGEASKTISVPVVSDAVSEGNETFTVTLSGPSAGMTLGTNTTATVTITDVGGVATWDGGGPDDNWSTALNWVGDVAPSAGASLVFPVGLTADMDNDTNLTYANVTFQGGYSVAGNPIQVSGPLVNSSLGVVSLNAHVQAKGALGITTSGTFNLNGGLDVAGNAVTVGGTGNTSINSTANSVPGAGGITSSATGQLAVMGNNDMGRSLQINAGTLRFDATGAANSSKSVAAAAKVIGTGSGGALTVDGIVAPGGEGTAGRLSSSTVDISGATFGVDMLNGTVATGYDQLRATSSMDVTGAILALNGAFAPAVDTVFTIIDNTSASAVTGTFAGLPEGAVISAGGVNYTVSYVGGTGNDVTLTASKTAGFANATVSVNEGAGSVDLTVARDSAVGSSSVAYATANGTATAGQDYVAKSGTVSFANGELSKTITIQVTNDEANETAETFTVSLSNPSAGMVVSAASVATVSIIDNDGPGDGYWLAATDGGVFAYGGAAFYGSMGGQRLNGQVVDVVSNESGDGYWLIGSDGGVFAFGNAAFHGSTGGLKLNSPVLGGARTPGSGYWLFAADGGVFSFGDAKFLGSMGGQRLNAPIVDMAVTPTGNGYWLFATDGGVFAFGDAKFYGSMGGTKLNSPVLGAARAPDGNGYWMTAADGGVFAFGTSTFYGSMGGQRLNSPIRSIGQTESGNGYWLFASDGGVFAYGDASFFGSMGGKALNAPIIAGTSNS